MVRVFVLLFVIHVILAALALISCLSAERQRIRGLPRAIWVPVIMLLALVGPVAWFLVGRPLRTPPAGTTTGRPRPPTPDDDPDFLRSLDAEQSRRDRELFEQWEDDLKRREDDLRRRHNGETPQGDPRPES